MKRKTIKRLPQKGQPLYYFSCSDAAVFGVNRSLFKESLDEKLKEADNLINRIDIALEVSEISKYVSLSKIASKYKLWVTVHLAMRPATNY